MQEEWREDHISKKTNVAGPNADHYYRSQRDVVKGAFPNERSIPNGIFYPKEYDQP
ncbi:unknown protein [Paenibacillus amylolyticus]|uniref:Uncharacterized protein n=1 Tax=Paenibacillus amylolyticus TaxID=1451 RepID=A0A100VQK2_PAEAM|nr:unknown protein [Paenibacillus amylolyticus]